MKTAESLALGFETKMQFFSPEIRHEKVLDFVQYVQRDARRDLLDTLSRLLPFAHEDVTDCDGNREEAIRLAEAALGRE